MRFALVLVLLAPLAGLSWLLEGEEEVGVVAEARAVEEPRRPATLAPRAHACLRPVAPQEGGVSVSGHVVGVGGRPVAGARVCSFDARDTVRDATVTDAEGRFRLGSAFWSGAIEVDAGARGWATTCLEDEDRLDVRLRLTPVATLHGRVFAADGATPVAAASVSLATRRRLGRVETHSRSNGTFTLPAVPRDALFCLAVDGGRSGRVLVPGLRWAPGASLEVVLDRVRVLRGRVVREIEEGRLVGVAGVRVRARKLTELAPGATTTTDEDGFFECTVFGWRGRVEVFSSRWFLPRGYRALGRRTEIELRVLPRATLYGRCVHGDGTPVEGAVVTLNDPGAADATSDETGRFALSFVGFDEGRAITARCGDLVGRGWVRRQPQPGDEHVVVLKRTASLNGRVLDDRGRPCPYVWVRVSFRRPRESWPAVEGEATDASGRFTVVDVTEGPCEVRIEACGFESLDFHARATVGGTDLGDLRVSRLRPHAGRLVDPTGAPICDGVYRVAEGAARDVPVRSDGTFLAAVPDDPESEVSFAAPGFVRRRLERSELPADQPWVIVLEPAPVIEGRLLGSDGHPMRSAMLACRGVGFDALASVWVDLNGAFRVELKRHGLYELTPRVRNFAFPEGIRVRSGTRGLVLRGRALPTITGRVVGPDGEGLASAEITARYSAGPLWIPRRTLCDDNGCFRLTGLAVGAYRLRVSGIPGGLMARKLEGVHAGSRDVVLEAVHPLSIDGRMTGVVDGLPGEFGVEAEAVGHVAQWGLTTMQPDGSFRIDGLLPGLYEVRAWRRTGPKTKDRSDPLRVYAGTDGLVLVPVPEEEGGSGSR